MEKKGNHTVQGTNVIEKILSQARSAFPLSMMLFQSFSNVRPLPGAIVIIVLLCSFEIIFNLPTTSSDERVDYPRWSGMTGRLSEWTELTSRRTKRRGCSDKKTDFPFGRLRMGVFWTVCMHLFFNLFATREYE